jgi:hypothetical protein
MNDASLRLAWLTDCHINLTAYAQRAGSNFGDFFRRTVRESPEAVLVDGSLADISDLDAQSRGFSDKSRPCPLDFTVREPGLAHDSITDFKHTIMRLCSGNRHLRYLGSNDEPVAISKSVALVGHDGWSDSGYDLNDPVADEFAAASGIAMPSPQKDIDARLHLDYLAEEAVDRLIFVLAKAVKHFPRVVLLTAVPPWLELCTFGERLRKYPYAPIYSSAMAGFAIERIMDRAPNCKLIVLSGRRGAFAKFRPRPNIVGFSGEEPNGPHDICNNATEKDAL